MTIRGCVEFMSPDGVVTGWVRDDDLPVARLEVEIRLDGALLIYVQPTADRPDTGLRSGYHAKLERHIDPFDLLSGRMQIRARNCQSGETAILPPTRHVAERSIRVFVDERILELDAQDVRFLVSCLKDVPGSGEPGVVDGNDADTLVPQGG